MIKGKIYSAGSADFLPAVLLVQNQRYQIQANSLVTHSGLLTELNLSPRIGNISRKVSLIDGSVFETDDNTAIDALVSHTRSSGFMTLIHKLEQNMLLALMSIFLIAAILFSSLKWGLPAASHVIAKTLPSSTSQVLSSNILSFLDKHMLEPSQLPVDQQDKIRQHFLSQTAPLYQSDTPPEFKLHFRLWTLDDEKSIANALALPSGDIIVTDRFIELSQSQDEIDIVLLHEMGHVVERHSLEQVIEGSALAIGISMAFGDVSWLADMGVGVGSFFISSFYSRSHETEADEFAYRHSLTAGIAPNSLGQILFRMEQDMVDSDLDKNNNEPQNTSLSGYFSTHPSSQQRTLMGKYYLSCFEQGIIECPTYKQP